ncbi:alanine racemase [candidate division Kazan bacterium RIFCSPHIGHO2_01_FULL_49_10]|uniref:Alanine racemase n=1 Tax=candidate division Kazan bacterium RIFCSPLOWO2_01_FULL_48_13 TaxID=1798539 RepID=A0A1F4PPJ1_UNCK3|nr:MAG: alanine racemase [candidate division Kazan bacterium RIFCSPHIGHO2_01_FULL_49_10]OGB84972.1 MAG: alanine racemase [candidate division Kazan bacterium RIFCSPLOWO2_01_FULL_48_13]
MKAPLAWINIDLKRIDHNIKQIKRLQRPDIKIIAIVKSNAYGHGILAVSLQAIKSGVDMLGVVSATEAIYLRKKGIIRPIVVMGAVAKEEMVTLVRNKVSFLVHNRRSLLDAMAVANIVRQRINLHVKLETGINRLGFSIDEAMSAIRAIEQHRHLLLEGIWTHLASVEELNKSYTKSQLFQFEKLLIKLKKAGIKIDKIPYISTAASAAAILMPESRFNAVRLGISMYGLWPSRGVQAWAKKEAPTKKIHLKPALRYRTRLISVRRIPAGSFVGYGCSFQSPKPMTLGIIPVGYAEGLPRSLSNMGFMLLKGAVVPVVGRICMNMTILDISKRPQSQPGDEVVIIGKSKSKEITATDIADWAGTINYEIITRLPESLERIYTN